jgi:hypothetical protein
MRSLELLAEAHPERVVLPETTKKNIPLEASSSSLYEKTNYDEQLKEAFAFIDNH